MRIIVALSSVFFVHSAFATTFHVAPNGHDSADGSSAAPWQTLQHAADVVAPGDTVEIAAGTYPGFEISTSGTQTAPIAFVAADPAAHVDGAATSGQDAIALDGASWIRIEGLTITGARRAGISAVTCSHVTVRGNHIDHNAKWGVFTGFCDDLVVENNEVSHSGTQHGVYASNSADHPVIRGNRIWGNAQCGIHMNGDISQGGDGVISGALVEHNQIYDNGLAGGSAINGDGIADAVIRNNVLDGNHASGISLYQIDGGAPSTGNLVINNTVRMASDARWAINIQNGSTGNVLRNNILLDAHAGRGAIDICSDCLAATVSDHNAVVGSFEIDDATMDLAGWRSQTGNDAASFVASDADLFTSATDLTLRGGSPAIDAGDPTDAPTTDMVGTPRPQGAGFDIGAYERCDGACNGSGSDGGSTGSGSDDGSTGSGSGSGSGDGSTGGSGTTSPPHGGGCATGAGAGPGLAFLALRVRRRRRR